MPRLITKSIYHRTVNGAELVRLMDRRGLNQKELAKAVGCSQGMISQIARPGKWEIRAEFAFRLQGVLE